ncbi:hypothetical protein GQ457_09G020060 [Hibiscus cannabinus]
MHEAWERYRDLYPAAQCMVCQSGRKCQYSTILSTHNQNDAWRVWQCTLLDNLREKVRDFGQTRSNDYQHPTARRGSARRGPAQLDSSDNILAQIATIHDPSECGQQVESSCYVGNYNRNNVSNTYNPAWRNHPNFSKRRIEEFETLLPQKHA